MGPIFIQSFSFFFISFFLCSDSSIVENLHKKEIQITRKLEFYPHSIYETELDTIPIVNPTPTTGTPIIIPESPPPPLTTTTPPIIVPESPPPPLTTTTPTVPPITTTPASSGGAWCVASQSASDTALQVALDYACGHGGADCSGIQPGASCYIPNSLRDHASYAFNDYYQKNPGPTSCVFGGTAMLTYTDPSSGTCHYPSAKTSTTPTPTTPVITTPTPPIVTTPHRYTGESLQQPYDTDNIRRTDRKSQFSKFIISQFIATLHHNIRLNSRNNSYLNCLESVLASQWRK